MFEFTNGKKRYIVGIDEAGRGPVIGPLVICAFVVEAEKHQDLKKMGAKDSKLTSKNLRKSLYTELKAFATDIKVKHISPAEIDELRKTHSLNVIEQQIMLKLVKKINVELSEIYIDAADVNEKRFGGVFEKEFPNATVISKHKADMLFPVVSAASIIAKVERDQVIELLNSSIDGDLGSGYPADPKTKAFLREYFSKHKKFPPYVRESWDTVKRIRKEFLDSKLTDYFDSKKRS
ncbi:MAG: ribonuclease HII [Candidatus Heimdallarchaeota archaeon]|nr:ribonuclease HII [Candidatus Heimdallarchaeota archaeon]